MSYAPTGFRPLARTGWGGNAASHFRGALSLGEPDAGLPTQDPQTLVGYSWGQIGSVMYRSVGARTNRVIAAKTLNSAGAALAACEVELFQTGGDIFTAKTVSDASGNYAFDNPGSGPFYVVSYKIGAPDVAGTTVNTLIAV